MFSRKTILFIFTWPVESLLSSLENGIGFQMRILLFKFWKFKSYCSWKHICVFRQIYQKEICSPERKCTEQYTSKISIVINARQSEWDQIKIIVRFTQTTDIPIAVPKKELRTQWLTIVRQIDLTQWNALYTLSYHSFMPKMKLYLWIEPEVLATADYKWKIFLFLCILLKLKRKK